MTAALIAQGYDGYGVEIDPEPVRNGYDLFRNRGLDPKQRLRVVGQTEDTSFPKGFFHVVCSFQVLEHLARLELDALEWTRITSDDAVGIHIYPSAWRVVEPHLMLPFLHWLPKNVLRQGTFALLFPWA